MAAIGVIVAVQGEQEGPVVASIEAHPDLAVVRRCADLAEALAAARAGLAMAVVISADPRLDRDAVMEFASCGVLVLGAARDPLDAQALANVGIEAPEDVAAVLARQLRGEAPRVPSLAASSPRGEGVIVTVWGTHGAPGRTTVAVNVAAELAAEGVQTLLVDLDAYAPSVGTAFAIEEESAGVAAVAHGVARGLDAASLIDRHALAIAPGLRVLTGLTRASRWQELSDSTLDALWPVLRAVAQVVVIDVAPSVEEHDSFGFGAPGPRRDAATSAALAEAEVVIAVGSAEPRQLQRLIAALVDAGDRAPMVVVNRVRAGVAGARPEHEIATLIGRLAGVPEIWPVPWDPRACDEADRLGRTLSEVAPRSAVRRSLRAVARGALTAAQEAAALAREDLTPRAAASPGIPVTD